MLMIILTHPLKLLIKLLLKKLMLKITYIKMNSSGKVVDQVVSGETETDVDDYIEMNQSFKVVDQTATDE